MSTKGRRARTPEYEKKIQKKIKKLKKMSEKKLTKYVDVVLEDVRKNDKWDKVFK